MNKFMKHFGLGEEASRSNRPSATQRPCGGTIPFASTRKSSEMSYRSRHWNWTTVGVLTAPADSFDECFVSEPIDSTNLMRFITEGRVVDERLKTRK